MSEELPPPPPPPRSRRRPPRPGAHATRAARSTMVGSLAITGAERRNFKTRWHMLADALLRRPLTGLGMLPFALVWAVADAHTYAARHVLHWGERGKLQIQWSHPAAIVVVPVAFVVLVLAMIFIAPISHALIARRRYLRWQETLGGRE